MGLNAFIDSKNHEPTMLINILKIEYEKIFTKKNDKYTTFDKSEE